MGPVKGGSVSELLKHVSIPKMFRAEQASKKIVLSVNRFRKR